MTNRDEIRRLANESIARGDATGWFEALYRGAGGDWSRISWADLVANPYLLAWLERPEAAALGSPCLVVGCGLGDDAEALAARGLAVVAFDVSPTAIEGCRARFPESRVQYVVADALAPPAEWSARFAFVFESYTLQVLPPAARAAAAAALARTVAPGGRLLVLCRARERDEPEGQLPWPLTRDELGAFQSGGLAELAFESFFDRESPPVRRFRALYGREGPEIRIAGAADAETLQTVVAAFRDHLGASEPADREIAERLPRLLRDPSLEFACASLEGRVVGYTQTRFLPSLWVAGGEALIEDLFVLPADRGRAVGRLLLRHALRRARERGATQLSLTTNERNEPAQALYRSEGLAPQGEKRWAGGREIRWVARLGSGAE